MIIMGHSWISENGYGLLPSKSSMCVDAQGFWTFARPHPITIVLAESQTRPSPTKLRNLRV